MRQLRVTRPPAGRLSAVALSLLCVQGGAMAATFLTDKPFDLTVNVNGDYHSATDSITGGTQTAPLGFTTVADLFSTSTEGGLRQVNKDYRDEEAAVIRFGYRGLPMVLTTAAGGKAVTLLIPGLDIKTPFYAQPTRDANVEDVKTFLKNSGGEILNRLQQLLAKTSPIDPIAGNPNSLQSRLVSDDFDRNFTQFATNIRAAGPADSTPVNNLLGIGLSYARYTQSGLNSRVTTLPLSYTVRPYRDPRQQWTFYAPLTVTEVAGAKAYNLNLGLAYRVPVTNAWALTPSVGYGIAASPDLGSAAAMQSASLTSQYTLQRAGYELAIGNMLGRYQSRKFSVREYSFDPKISNTVLRNGLLVSIPTRVMGTPMAFELSWVHTRYSGTELYSSQYNEIGMALGSTKSANAARSYLRASVTYLQGEHDIRGLKLNVGYWF